MSVCKADSGNSSNTLRIFNTTTWEEIDSVGSRMTGCRWTQISNNERFVAVGGNNHNVIIFNLPSLTYNKTLSNGKYSDLTFSGAFSPDDNLLATGTRQDTDKIIIWNTDDWTHKKTITSGQNHAYEIDFNTNGSLIASGSIASTADFTV